MNAFVTLSALLAVAAAEPSLLLSGYGGARLAAAPAAGILGYGAGYGAGIIGRPAAGILGAGYANAAIAPAAIAPAAAIAAPSVSSSQYHKQDELGNYEYGYENINSAKREKGNAYAGVVEGSYSYVDGYGLNRRVNYVADALGFRTDAAPAATLLRHRRSLGHGLAAGYASPIGYGAGLASGYASPIGYGAGLAAGYGSPIGYGAGLAAGYASPIGYGAAAGYAAETVSAPASREAILTRIQLNPGHAVAYRVD